MANLKKPLPSNRDLEYTILGTSLVDSTVLSMVIEQLNDEDFHSAVCREVFRLMKRIVGAGNVVDIITVEEKIRKNGREDLFEEYMVIAGSIGSIENCEGYIKELVEYGITRKLIRASNEIEKMCFSVDGNFSEIVDTSEKLVQNAVGRVITSTDSGMADVMSITINHMEDVHSGRFVSISTGFDKLDELTCGFEAGDVVIIGGRPSSGKTALATAMATSMAIDKGMPGTIFSLETTKHKLGQRMIAQKSQLNLLQLRKGLLPKREYSIMQDAIMALSKAPIRIDDDFDLFVSNMRYKLRGHINKYGIRWAMVDYLQLMQYVETDRRLGIEAITRGVKKTAKELKIPIILLSQLSRAAAGRGKEAQRPILSDLRESGSIEQDADIVLFTHREHYYDKEADRNDAEIIIAKQKNGPCETVHLHWIPECATFLNAGPEKW